jgi:hypothetical protein
MSLFPCTGAHAADGTELKRTFMTTCKARKRSTYHIRRPIPVPHLSETTVRKPSARLHLLLIVSREVALVGRVRTRAALTSAHCCGSHGLQAEALKVICARLCASRFQRGLMQLPRSLPVVMLTAPELE